MRYVMAVAFTLILACSGIGCATGRATAGDGLDAIELTLTGSGTLLLDGKAVALERLASKLKSHGATPDTEIRINIPADTSPSQRKSITSRLFSAGFLKVVLRGPRHAEASVVSPPSPRSMDRTPRP